MSDNNFPMDVGAVMQMIPHRYPMLLVDRVIEYSPGSHLIALKNVTFNEPFFNGHFPNQPIMPGVLIIEALAQASALYVTIESGKPAKDCLVYFMSILQAKFRKPVIPGDSLHLHVSPLQSRRNVHKMSCQALVDGVKVTEAELTAMIAEKE